MAEIVVFHHALGLTDGVRGFADTLREAGHTVHAPDLYDGATFTDLEAGVARAQEIGFGALANKGVASLDGLPEDVVYVGFSLGAVPAQMAVETRPGARGALLCYSALPPGSFGDGWPAGVPVQIHFMSDDEFAQEDAEAIAALRDQAGAEVFEYPGAGHLFADPVSDDYDPAATALLTQRAADFLARLG